MRSSWRRARLKAGRLCSWRRLRRRGSRGYGRGLGWLLYLNPVVPFLELLRAPIVEGQLPSPLTYANAGIIVVLFTAVAAELLRREERRLIFLF